LVRGILKGALKGCQEKIRLRFFNEESRFPILFGRSIELASLTPFCLGSPGLTFTVMNLEPPGLEPAFLKGSNGKALRGAEKVKIIPF